MRNDHTIWWWWWRGWRKSQPRVSLEQKASCTRNGAACPPCCAPPGMCTNAVHQCAPPGMFQSKCTYPGGPIPPSFHCFTKFKQQSLPYFVSSQCISTNWNVMFKNLLQSNPSIYSANNFVLPFPDFYSYDQPTELPICLLQEHHCTLVFSPTHNLLLKMPIFFTCC